MPCDYSKYPRNWFTFYRPYCMIRAGEHATPGGRILSEARCENCGAVNHLRGVVLTIAHLDHDAENPMPALTSLRAWCQKCHNGYDAPTRRSRRIHRLDSFRRQQQLFRPPL